MEKKKMLLRRFALLIELLVSKNVVRRTPRLTAYGKISLLSLGIFTCVIADAQQKEPHLEIGDSVPELTFTGVVNSLKPIMKLSEFKGKNVILDFWATYCEPCIKQFPLLDSIQVKYKKDIQILSVTSDLKKVVEQSYDRIKARTGIQLTPSVTFDTTLKKIFPHRMIPHYVWIGKDRIVKAITGPEAITEENIQTFISNKPMKVQAKADDLNHEDFDYNTPPIRTKVFNVDKNNTVYNSVFTKYIAGLGTQHSARPTFILFQNSPIILMYKFVFTGLYGKGWEFYDDNRFILEGFTRADSLEFGYRTYKTEPEWLKVENEKCYNYELSFPDSISQKRKLQFVLQDLNRIFSFFKGFEASIESRPFNYLMLRRMSTHDKVKSKGGRPEDIWTENSVNFKNMPFSDFVEKLKYFCYSDGINLPLSDKTGFISSYVDIAINVTDPSIDNVNKELRKYDLELIKGNETINMVVVKKIGK